MNSNQSQNLLKIPDAGTKIFYQEIKKALQNPLETLCNLTKKYGGIVQIKIVYKKFMVVESPEYFKYILQDKYKNFPKHDLSGLLTNILGHGLITINGKTWLQQRRTMQPAFHKTQLEGILSIIHQEVDKLIDALRRENGAKPIDICKQFMDLNFRVITRMLFGEAEHRELKEISEIMNDLAIEAEKQLTQAIKLPLSIPTPANLRFKRVRKKFDSLIYSIIHNRKIQLSKGAPIQPDILQMLLTAGSEDKDSALTDEQIRDELTTLFMAGYETTSQTLGWLFYRVAKHPDIAAAIRAETKEVLAGQSIALPDLAKLRYTSNVIKETMRFYPSVWLMVRKNLAADTLAQHYLPKQSILLLNVYGLHHNEAYWDKPEEFLPDRFDAANLKDQHPFCYVPFGKGPRLCIGEPFAMMLMQVVTSRLVSTFECVPTGDIEVKMDPQITLKPKPGIYIQFNPLI